MGDCCDSSFLPQSKIMNLRLFSESELALDVPVLVESVCVL